MLYAEQRFRLHVCYMRQQHRSIARLLIHVSSFLNHIELRINSFTVEEHLFPTFWYRTRLRILRPSSTAFKTELQTRPEATLSMLAHTSARINIHMGCTPSGVRIYANIGHSHITMRVPVTASCYCQAEA